jgi:glycyl-tRNA synthetase
MADTKTSMEKIVALCKRRGFIFQSSEIYGGIGGFWDYGPLGTELKRNIKDAWWNDMVQNPPPGPDGIEYQMVGVDCSIIMNPKVWEASGHVGGFKDPMVACKADGCKKLFRADKVFRVGFYNKSEHGEIVDLIRELSAADSNAAARLNQSPAVQQPKLLFSVEADSREDAIATYGFPTLSRKEQKLLGDVESEVEAVAVDMSFRMSSWPSQVTCPACKKGELTEPRDFNLMFESHAGALQSDANKVYLRPETAQGIFVNFKNVMDSTRVKIPFGIAQIGKSFRNEINPRNFTFRSREFEQMEIEFFCKPDTSRMWYEFWRDVRIKWYESLNIKSDKLRPREQGEDELAHYSDACTDIEYLFPFSDEPQELEGVAHRGCYDLAQHGKHAKGKENAFAVMDDETKERYLPHVIEPSAGADRFTLATITEAYTVDESRPSPEFMKFHPRLAPVKAAVFPLVAKDGLPEIAEPIYREIKKKYPAQFDAKQSIGKRYARMDEAGTPYCFTVDSQTKEDGTVTVRDRDTGHQERIAKEAVGKYLQDKLDRHMG